METDFQRLEKKRRFRYAAGYVVQQEGTEPVERLIRNGETTRFGVRQSLAPNQNLNDLGRDDAEDILKKRVWDFYGYDEIEALTVPAKIFDSHILFNFTVASENAREALGLDPEGGLDRTARKEIEAARSQDFFSSYTTLLEQHAREAHGGREAIIRRANRIPPRNVNAQTTG